MTIRLGSALFAALALAACGGEQPAAPGAPESAPPPAAMLDEDPTDPKDTAGVYTGTVGGKPGFMIAFQTQNVAPWTVFGITQRGASVSAFDGSGPSPTTKAADLDTVWAAGGGTIHSGGEIGSPRSAIVTGTWNLGVDFVGSIKVDRNDDTPSLLDFDLKFDPITLAADPAGPAMPAGTYDILSNETDIGDYVVAAPGSATGSVTWPGASAPCEIGVSTGIRAPGTKRNVWQIQFNTDVTCSPAAWSIGYAVTAGGGLTYELYASRGLATHGRPSPAGEQDAMHLQLRRRS